MRDPLMAKTKQSPITSVTIKYDLFDVPTAQHKAGLAGLLLEIGSMKQRKKAEECYPDILAITPTSATIRFTKQSVQGLFDDLYDAGLERVEVRSKWQGQEPIEFLETQEVDPDGGPPRPVRKFVYEVVQPRGHFLRQYLPPMDPTKDWHKLWREMLWAIPRGIPMT